MASKWEKRPVFIAGVGLNRWGHYPNMESYEFGSEVILKALSDADLAWDDVQAVFCGSVYQGTASGHKVIKQVGLTGVPIVNVENACSSSASALRLAYQQIAAEICDAILVLGIEKNPKGPIPSNSSLPWEAQLGFNFLPGHYALETVKYMHAWGVTEDDISLVTVKNRKNASLNEYACYQEPVTLDDVRKSRVIASPLRLLHCCPLADGASAAIVCSRNKLKSVDRAVRILACTLTSASYKEEYVPGGIIRSVKYPEKISLAAASAKEAYEMAGLGPRDIDVVQAYDTVSASELWDIEELGLCEHGQASKLLREGALDIDGKIPVNTDGGLMGRGHPMGATALAQIIEIVTQLRGEAGARQVANARIGLAHAMGSGPNSSVTIMTKNL